MKKILVALSGGMDSAAAVLKLRSDGYEPIGLYMDMLNSDEALRKVRNTAAKLDVELLTEDCSQLFRETVTDYFFRSYLRGETPAPCSVCNPQIKWHILTRAADRLGIYKIATGHYCRTTDHNGKVYLSRGTDPIKDQSYFLWGLDSTVLSRAVFPLGDSLKQHTRLYLIESGHENIESQTESMSVCFLGNGGYEEFIRREAANRNIIIEEGDLLDMSGNVIGRHCGIPFYTIGQKRGIVDGLAVVKVDAVANTITAGSDDNLYTNTLLVKDWIATDINELTDSPNITIMVRGIGRNPHGYASVKIVGSNLSVSLSSPAWAVAQGQPAVFYIEDRVIGGGFIG